MEQKTFQGCKNDETWLVLLHLNHNEASYQYWLAEAGRISDEASEAEQVVKGVCTVEQAARHKLAERLQVELAEAAPGIHERLYAELLNAALNSVDWDTLACYWLEKAR